MQNSSEYDRRAFLWGRMPTAADFAAAAIVILLLVLFGFVVRQMLAPSAPELLQPISLSPLALPNYALRTTMRMLVALGASFLFTLTYATLAAKSRRAEMILIPLLDVLQSVPVLGYLSFTVTFFVALFPGSMIGPELAAVFAIFTSQAWNMAFSFYQALRTIPHDLTEAAQAFRFSAWQRFWRLEAPFAVPGLIWNMMMSMSGGWFFVVASEAISVGNINYTLPGVGSYVAKAIEARDLHAVLYAILAMTITILIYDQLLFRPLVAWSDKFRFEQTAAQTVPTSPILELFRRSGLMRRLGQPIALSVKTITRLPLRSVFIGRLPSLSRRAGDILWLCVIAAVLVLIILQLARFIEPALTFADLRQAMFYGLVTLLRVSILIAIATAVWVPIGVYVGLRPKLAEKVQPLAQFLAAFPANLLFPVAVFFIANFRLNPDIWVSPLMILGTQWYILFNVIAGTTAYPTDFKEAAATFRIRGWRWWRDVMLPGIFPYYVTGAISASGGAWNASIVSEAVSWGHTKIVATGLGAYIAQMTAIGDYPKIALGVAVMSTLVILMNRLLWRPLYALAQERARLD